MDLGGKAVELRTKLGEGGEGAVWASPLAGLAIKTYIKGMPLAQVEKLTAMASMAEPSLLAAAAWPTRIVYDAARNPIGFEMPRLFSEKPFHDVIGMKSRNRIFPNANWQMLVHAAGNLARAFDGLHAKNIVVGDVNSNNVVVRDDARVLFIDCDSFQIRTLNRTFRCGVGVPDYQPPELQNVDLDSIDRLASHDAFGMAVMIFQLLFVGKHPFTGRPPNPGANALTPGENIVQGNYFYDAEARRRGLQPPPASLSLAAVTPSVGRLFDRAFRGVPTNRPTGGEWSVALAELERSITTCTVDVVHRYLRGTPCPWCAIELQTRIVYFAAPTLMTASGDVDDSIWSTFPNSEAERLWKAIAAVPTLRLAGEPLSAAHAKPSPISEEARRKRTTFATFVAAFAFVAIFIWFVPAIRFYDFSDALVAVGFWALRRPSGGAELADRKVRRRDARSVLSGCVFELKKVCEGGEFEAQRRRLAAAHATVVAQRAVYDGELAEIKRAGENTAKRQYLDSKFIRDAKIKGIGDNLAVRLAAANIETALDVGVAVRSVSGIGEKKALALIAWRTRVEQEFRFEPKMIDGAVRDLKTRHVKQRTQARNALVGGERLLRDLGARLESRCTEMRAEAVQARKRADQAEADMRPFSPLVFR